MNEQNLLLTSKIIESIRQLISDLILNNFEKIISEGHVDDYSNYSSTQLYMMMYKRYPQENGENIFNMPPDTAIVEAVMDGELWSVFSPELNEWELFPDESYIRTYGDLIEKEESVNNSMWSIQVPMWVNGVSTVLSLMLDAYVANGDVHLKIERIEVM